MSANASAPVMKKICDALRPRACSRSSVSAVYEGPRARSQSDGGGGIGGAAAAQLLVAGAQPRHAGHREARHREAMEGGRERLHRTMGWNGRRDDEHGLQIEGG